MEKDFFSRTIGVGTYFFWEKNGGQILFLPTKKGGPKLFLLEKKGGRILFSPTKMGGQVLFFDRKFDQNPARVPDKFLSLPYLYVTTTRVKTPIWEINKTLK